MFLASASISPPAQGANTLYRRYIDHTVLLKSLDHYLAHCGKTEAAKIDPITYVAITDLAAVYRVYRALRMHRPTPCSRYETEDEARKTYKESYIWTMLDNLKEISKASHDPRRRQYGNEFENLNQFRMPTGKKTHEWLDRADNAVSGSPLRYHQSSKLSFNC